MIPLRDNIPTRRLPLVTILLIVANVVVFLADRLIGHDEVRQVVTTRGVYLMRDFVGGLSPQYAMIPASVTHDLPNAWKTVLTAMFLHANWLHVGGNMLYLWIFGNNIEDVLGRGRFVLFYLLCGVAAAATHIFSDPNSAIPTVGASGAVAGIMGAYLILYPNAQILTVVPLFFLSTLMDVPAVLVIGFWAVLQFVNASWMGGGGMLRGGGVAYFAHIGGFVVGILLILLLGGRRLTERQPPRDVYFR